MQLGGVALNADRHTSFKLRGTAGLLLLAPVGDWELALSVPQSELLAGELAAVVSAGASGSGRCAIVRMATTCARGQ